MLRAVTRTGKIAKSSETSVWLAYDRTSVIVFGNSSKSPRGLQGSTTRPISNAFASPQNSDVSTDASGTVVETLDYYPFGGIRIDNTTSTAQPEIRKYTGQIFDQATQLTYDNARYYNGTQGQFISQDPMFLGNQSTQNLSDPQSLNAYSYSEDNPIVKSDPTGRCIWDGCVVESLLVVEGLGALGGVGVQAYSDFSTGAIYQRSFQQNVNTYVNAASLGGTSAVIGAAGNAAADLADFSLLSKIIVGGGTAGILTGSSILAQNHALNQSTDPTEFLGNIGGSVLTGGIFPMIDIGEPFDLNVSQSTRDEALSDSGQIISSSAAHAISAASTPTTGSYSSGGSGPSQQQLQNIQSQINQIQGEINEIQSEINNSKK